MTGRKGTPLSLARCDTAHMAVDWVMEQDWYEDRVAAAVPADTTTPTAVAYLVRCPAAFKDALAALLPRTRVSWTPTITTRLPASKRPGRLSHVCHPKAWLRAVMEFLGPASPHHVTAVVPPLPLDPAADHDLDRYARPTDEVPGCPACMLRGTVLADSTASNRASDGTREERLSLLCDAGHRWHVTRRGPYSDLKTVRVWPPGRYQCKTCGAPLVVEFGRDNEPKGPPRCPNGHPQEGNP